MERHRNMELQAEVRRKDELTDQLNSQVIGIPTLKVELAENKEEIRRDRSQERKDNESFSLEKERLFKQVKTKEHELDELQEEIRKLKASGMVNSLNDIFHNFFKIEQEEQEEAESLDDLFMSSPCSKGKITFQLSSSDNSAKRAKLDQAKPLREITTYFRDAQLTQDRDFEEEFWRKLAAEEERKQDIYNRSSWKVGATSRPRDNLTSRIGQESGSAGQKRKLFTAPTSGPQQL